MDKIRFISDTHFDHRNIVDYCGRPVDYQRKIFEHLDSLQPCEMMIHIGDFGFVNRMSTAESYFLRMPTDNAILIVGNHDKRSKEVLKCGWTRVIWPKQQPFKIEYAGLRFAIQHRPFSRQKKHHGPLLQWLNDLFAHRGPILPEDADIIIHGHIHELGQRYRWREDKLVVNACVEHWDYKSFSIDEVVKEYHDRKQYYKNYRPRPGSRKH